MTYETAEKTSGFRQLNPQELHAISGGNLHENGGFGYGAGVPIQDPFGVYSDLFGPPSCFVVPVGTYCQDPDGINHITVTAYTGITDFQGDVEVRHTQDGTKMLFIQGLYQGDIEWTDGSATLDDPDLAVQGGAGKEGVQFGGSVVTEGGTVMNYRFVYQPGR